LYLEFPDLADSILHILSPEPNTIWGKIKSELSSLYSIRVVDPEKAVEGSVEYILLAIEECLQIKDVTKALSYLARLGPQIDTIAESWVQKAENYLQIELAVHQLEAYAFWQSLGHSLEGVTPLSHNTVIPQESGSAR